MKNKRENYKNKQSGVYQIKNYANNKVYVGSSHNLRKRFNEHKLALKKNIHVNKYLQNDYNVYGMKNFKFEILQITENTEKLFEIEQMWIVKTQCFDRSKGYNICKEAGKPNLQPQNGENNYCAKISNDIAKKIKYELIKQPNKTIKEIAEEFYTTEGIVSSIKYLRSWTDILPEYNRELESLIRENLIGENHPFAILNANQVADIKSKLINNISIKELAEEYGVNTETIGEIKRCRRWKYISKELNSTLLSLKGEISPKTDEEIVYQIKKLLAGGKSVKEVSEITNVKIQTIRNIKLLNRWKNVGSEFNEKLMEIKVVPKLSEDDVREIRKLLIEGYKQSDIALKFNVNRRTISEIKAKRQYKNI